MRQGFESAGGKVREAVSTACDERSGEDLKPMRASAQPGFGPDRARILAVKNALEPRGTMISWSSEQGNVMSGTA
jgi:hypothetical protein